MTKYNTSVFSEKSEDNYILSTKGLVANGFLLRRNGDSQTLTNDGTSDTSSSVKETKMIRTIKILINILVAM